MNSYKSAIAIAIGTLFAGAAFAQSNYEIEQRDRSEQARIDRGVQSGQLTSREADRLQGQRSQIERMESRARSDGVLTQHERARIDGAQDRLGRDIYRESHDRQTADSNGRHHGWDRGNGNGWGRGHDNGRGNDYGRGHDLGRGNDYGRGHDFGRGNDQRQFGNRDGGRGEHNTTHAGNTTPGTGNSHGWTPRTGTPAQSGPSDRSGGRQASMPQAQPRSTPTQGTRTVVASRQGSGGSRTR